jgi:hypothetical protein
MTRVLYFPTGGGFNPPRRRVLGQFDHHFFVGGTP